MTDLNDPALTASTPAPLHPAGAFSGSLLTLKSGPGGLTGSLYTAGADAAPIMQPVIVSELAGITAAPTVIQLEVDPLPLADLAALIERTPSLALLSLPVAPAALTDADRILFDAGFVRMAAAHDPWPIAGRTSYLRSDLVTDIDHLGEPTGGVVSMSTLGSYGRFGNQLFQWAFLKLYALRSNCRVQAGAWIGNALYGARAEPSDPKLQRQIFIEFTGIERTLWYLSDPPVNLDFQGFFQEIPPIWRRHKALFKLMFRPRPDIAGRIDEWLAQSVPTGSTLVGIHIRRGDYLVYNHEQYPWFRPIPVEWYRNLLDRLWPTLEKPVLILATDEAMLVRHFHDYSPIVLPAPLLADEAIQYFPDFHALCRCDVLTVINSSFSRMAGLLGGDRQKCFLPDMVTGVFEPYDPWNDDGFWERFERR